MSPVEIGFIGFAFLIVIIMLGVNVAFALIIVGFGGIVLINGLGPALATLETVPFERATNYEISVIPLFLLMSQLVDVGNIGKEAFDMARAWLGQYKGGLAMATTGACGLFAACCGSSLASAVAMGRVSYPEMKRYNYDDGLSVATAAAGGSIGILIPPSMGFIIYGILTQISIGKLFIAGIIPGILQVLFYMATISVICNLNPHLGPPTPKTSMRQKFDSLRLTWPVILLFVLIIGGLYVGIFTPTEAGGIGAFGALAIGLVRRQITGSNFADSLLQTAKISAMVIALIVGAFVFNQFLAITRIPFVTGEYIAGLGLNKYVVLFIVLILYIILGMLLDIYSACVLTIPVIYPVMMGLGFDPIWYGVIMVRIMEMGVISPPFAMNIFALAGVTKVPISRIYRAIIPFLISDIFHMALLCAVPWLSTLLPALMIKSL